MRMWWVIGALAGAALLAAATAVGLDAVTAQGVSPPSLSVPGFPGAGLFTGGMPSPSTDVPEALAEQELCAATIQADARDVVRRLTAADDAGAGFALRNDQFRSAWFVNALRLADPSRDWPARIAALSARVPGDPGAPAFARAYVDCLELQNRDPGFVAALHAYLPYNDAP